MDKQKSVKAVIFDFDGTLVDLDFNIEITRRKLTEYFEQFGFDLYIRPIYPKIFMALSKLREVKTEEEVKQIKKKAFSLMDIEESNAKVSEIKGAHELLDNLKKQGIKTAIISVNGEKIVSNSFKKFKFPEPDIIVGRDTTDFVKPDPKIGKFVLNNFKLKPEEVLLVGDTDYDIQLANKLKIKSIWFKNKFPLKTSEPTYRINKLNDVVGLI